MPDNKSLLLLSTDLGASSPQRALLSAVTLALASLVSLLQAVQSIGNLGQQLGQGKELWMAPLHPFLLQSVSRVRDFLDRLVDVDGDEGEFLWSCRIWLLNPTGTPLRDFPFSPPAPQH